MTKKLSVSSLRKQRKQLTKELQELEPLILRGSLIERYKKCGKPNCKCSLGKGHGPKYYLSVTFPQRNPVLIYVPKNLKTEIESAILNYQKAKKIMEELSNVNRELFIRKELF